MKPLLKAHRGDRKNFPENTFEAFSSAFEKGADGIEFDVQLNQENIPIVVHDYLFDKTQEYPFLETVFEKFGKSGRLEIEIKSLNPLCITKVGELVNKYTISDFEITSSILPLLPTVIELFPKVKIGMIFKNILIENWMTPEFIEGYIIGYLNLTRSTTLHLNLEFYTPHFIKELHKRKFIAHTHLYNDDINMYKIVKDLGIDQCTFDDIALLSKLK